MLRALGPDLAKTVAMTADNDQVGGSPLEEIFENTRQVHKLRHYLPIYEATFGRTQRMLEIGVDRGGSLQMWREYLPNSTIVGIDINPAAAVYDAPERDMHVRIGDQTDTEFLSTLGHEFGEFDTVLDDGGHTPKQMIASFQYLFPRLKPGGVYLVEDVCANYWTAYRDQQESFIDFVRYLMDAMHAGYMGLGTVYRLMEGDRRRVTEVRVPFAATIIEKIEVFDSIVVVHRAAQPKPLPRSAYH